MKQGMGELEKGRGGETGNGRIAPSLIRPFTQSQKRENRPIAQSPRCRFTEWGEIE